MPQADPITETLLNLFEATSARKQAELNLERARAKEAARGRTAVPGVMAQLAEQREKAAAKAQKIREQGTGQQRAAALPVAPQLTDVTGQVSGRTGQGGLATAAEIANAVSGGRLAKTGAGRALGVGGPAVGAGTAGQAALPVLPPGGGTAIPGGVLTQQQALGLDERLLRGLLGGRQGRIQAIRGRVPVDVQRLPTRDELAARLAQAKHRTRRTGSDLGERAQRAQLLQRFGAEELEAIDAMAVSRELMMELNRTTELEDPTTRAKRTEAEIFLKAAAGEQLEPGEQAVFDRGKRGVQIEISQPGTAAKLEQKIVANQDLIGQLDAIEAAVFPEFFQRGAGVRQTFLQQKAKLTGLTPQETEELQRFSRLEQAVGALTIERVRALAGATMSAAELRLIEPSLPRASDDFVTFQQKSANFRELLGLSSLRSQLLLNVGVRDPELAMPLANTRVLARNIADGRFRQLQEQGLDENTALEQVTREFRAKYGLDIQRLLIGP